MSISKIGSNILIHGVITIMLALSAVSATAETKPVSQQQTQVAGFYRTMIGDYEITSLYDGYVSITNDHLKGLDDKRIDELFKKMFIDSSNGVQTAVNAFLINTNQHLILVDTGAAKCFGDSLGNIRANINAAGYSPEQIDMVLLTHLHPDHACGVMSDNQMVFPNATLYVAKAEADYWLSKEVATKAPEATQFLFEDARAAVAPYQAANKFKVFTSKLPIEGIQLVNSLGHTPGHSSYLFSSKGQELLVWGDIIHSHSIQFQHPEVALDFDTDSKQAVITRNKILADAAKNKLWVAGAHLPFPGLGHVVKKSTGYRWVPVEFSPIINK